MELRFECRTCGQHLSATLAQIGLTAPCPNCSSHVTVPDASTLPAPVPAPLSSASQTTPRPRSTPNFARPSRHTPRHGTLYYVFWGTISLSATLAVLFVAFVFLTDAGAAFRFGLSHHPPATKTAATQEFRATQNLQTTQDLPALNGTEIEHAQTLITGLRSTTETIKGVTWYSPDPVNNYKTAVYLYIGKKQTGQPQLRWQIRYAGQHSLFIRRYRLRIDKAEAVTVLATEEIERQNSGGTMWETFDEPADRHAHVLNQMLAGNTAYLRMEGTKTDKDIRIGPEQLQRMRDVLLVFRYLGGRWPTD